MFAVHMRRIHAIVLATLLLLVLGVVASVEAQAASPCGSRQYSDRTETVCVTTPSKTTQKWVIGYKDSVENGGVGNMRGTCTASTSKTVTYSLSLSIGAEAKAWIFAKVSATVTGGLSTSLSTGYVTSASFDVPRGKTVICERGLVTQNFKGVRKTTIVYKNSRPNVNQSANWTGNAPAMARWKIYTA